MRLRFSAPRPRWAAVIVVAVVVALAATPRGSVEPARAIHGMVVAQEPLAAAVGVRALRDGGSAVDAAVATALALAVTHPTAGNIGGGGFMIVRPPSEPPAAYDFREVAPAAATPDMFLVGGDYDRTRHHTGHLSVGVPGTVAGLYLAWREHGRLEWSRLVEPAIDLARDGFLLSPELARSLEDVLGSMAPYPASVTQYSRDGTPYAPGDRLRQPDLAATLARIAQHGADGFYQGETARLIAHEMQTHGGLITEGDLASYRAIRRTPLTGSYRGFDLLSMPPISSGGTALIEMLNLLEGYDLDAAGFGSAETVHLMVEVMRRAYADRASHLGDPAFNPEMPIDRLISKSYADGLRRTISLTRASSSSPDTFVWPTEGHDTTHLSVVDDDRMAVALTYTLEQRYGSKIVVPGAGFLLNNEMGDFNAGPGITTQDGLIGTAPNLAAPGKRMLSSMTPTVLTRDGELVLVTGASGGRTIINTVLQIIVNLVDFGMNVQEAVTAPRFHHQWLPDEVRFERHGLSPDTRQLLESRGHTLVEVHRQGVAQAIGYDSEEQVLLGGPDPRSAESTAVGY